MPFCLQVPHGAREMEEETARIRRLRDAALESGVFATSPPRSAVFDRPDQGFIHRIAKAQKKAFDVTKGPRAKGLERRAGTPPQTKGTWPRCS